jgi:D-alanine-D-alanine ligase
MRVAVLHNAVSADAPAEDQDTLVQVGVVTEALRKLDHEPAAVSCTLDLASMRDVLLQTRPEVVFNLVEALGDSDALVYLPLAVLDAMRLRYAGNRTESLFLTTHKVLAKQRMREAGLPTPDWIEDNAVAQEGKTSSWIIKGVCDQGSRDMEDDAVLRNVAVAEVCEHLRHRTLRLGRPCFAEQFIEGRELMIALLANSNGPEMLPPAEIEFAGFPPDKPKIVGYRAKWRDDCFEYHQTPSRFTFSPADQPLLEQLRGLAVDCWRLFGLRGWARVDFRVDAAGQPWILEVNANPCLSPDAGFAAALAEASISTEQAIQRILDDAA